MTIDGGDANAYAHRTSKTGPVPNPTSVCASERTFAQPALPVPLSVPLGERPRRNACVMTRYVGMIQCADGIHASVPRDGRTRGHGCERENLCLGTHGRLLSY